MKGMNIKRLTVIKVENDFTIGLPKTTYFPPTFQEKIDSNLSNIRSQFTLTEIAQIFLLTRLTTFRPCLLIHIGPKYDNIKLCIFIMFIVGFPLKSLQGHKKKGHNVLANGLTKMCNLFLDIAIFEPFSQSLLTYSKTEIKLFDLWDKLRCQT